ncbi:hypothetical protein L1987_11455 [Smallanthus sonchifolius]|uniref:Uncharacterized protein n=1 Tax=Smallanthus sonchifolius TaxID=185202 RepID=A0ACB9JB07_9ASTR|nr:hypothetical protein L1987_11455 [Smallanthus sonchifolius]
MSCGVLLLVVVEACWGGEEHEALKKKYQEECQMLKNRCQLEFTERRRTIKSSIRGFEEEISRRMPDVEEQICRPLNRDEIAKRSTSVVEFDSSQENKLKIIGSDSSKNQFKFDHIFGYEDNQGNERRL